MPEKQDYLNRFTSVPAQTEEFVRQNPYLPPETPSDILDLIHKFKFYRAELEIRDEKLKSARRELSELHRKLEDLYEFAPCGYVTLNKKGIISGINLTGNILLGASKRLLLNSSFCLFIASEYVSPFLAALRKAAESGRKQCLEMRLKREKEETLWVLADIQADWNESGTLNQWRVVLMDITQKKDTEAALLENQTKLQSLSDHTGDMLFLHDLEGNIIEVNRRSIELSGYSREELISMRVFDLDPDCHANGVGGAFWETLDVNQTSSFEARQQCKDGTIYPVKTTASKVILGGAIRVMALVRNVTTRQQYENELILSKQQAEAASRAKSEFLSNMSHEIRTPLNGVKGMIELARMKTCEPKTAEYLDYAGQSADHLLDLINDVLDLSKIESGKIEARFRPMSLREVVQDCVELFAVKAGDKGIDLSFTVGEDVPDNLRGDAGHLRQVLMNVLGNAVKFTDQGRVELRVGRVPGSREKDRLTIRFQIQDTGIGIPVDEQESIFESFEQVNSSVCPKSGGTGLGLAISKRLVEIMGGEIQLKSREGEGSNFSFTVAFKPEELSAEEPVAVKAEQLQDRNLRILVAEDSKMNQIYILDLLESLGHTPVLAETGREAIRKLAKGHFDLVLMDIRMPEMDGAEATRIIRNEPPEGIDRAIPVVALTAHAFTNEIEGFMQDGFTAYLTKPIDMEKLKKTLAKL